ncbi:MAG: class I lanthipeptide [Tannerellaceae bacterium]|nr:class I lanthipeptide [Tannerellaceae bacterium]
MKKRKLVLKKETVVHLSNEAMSKVKGGTILTRPLSSEDTGACCICLDK